jgi:hypothetical protein
VFDASQHGDKVDMPESEAQLAAPQKDKELLSNQVIKLELGGASRVHDELTESQYIIKALKEEGGHTAKRGLPKKMNIPR